MSGALTELSDSQLSDLVERLGGKPFQARQISHWLWKHGVTTFDEMRRPARSRDRKSVV